jgi:chromosome partitioning protein
MYCQSRREGRKDHDSHQSSSSLATAEKKVLLIDGDPQGNTTSGMGIDKASIENKNLYHALIGKCSLEEVIVKTQIPTLDVAPSNQDLVGVEIEFVSLEEREKKLRALLAGLQTHPMTTESSTARRHWAF